MEKDEGPKMNPDDLKLLIEQNEYLKYWLKSLNGIQMSDEDTEVNYEELWNNVALRKKIPLAEPTPEAIEFYFNLFSCGVDNFGGQCFASMAKTDPGALGYGIYCLLSILTENAKDFDKSVDIIE